MENSGIVPTLPVGGNGLGFGGDGIWALLIFAMIFSGGGFFGNNRGENLATQGYVASEFTQRDIAGLGTEVNNGFQNTNNLIAGGLANINAAVLENKYAGQLAACQTQRDVLTQTNELNTNILTTALQNQSKMDECCCAIRTAIREDGEATRALITANTIQDLRDRLQDAQNTITANNIGVGIVSAIRPYPVPAWAVSSPYVSLTPATTTAG